LTGDLKQRNTDSYDLLYSGRYRGDAFEALNKGRIASSLVRAAGVAPGGRVLDVGFGWGTALEMLHHQGFQAFGVEITPHAIAAARARLPQSILVVAEATDLPFPDGYFDVLICSHVLEHLPQDSAVIAELYRVLKPAGWAVLGVPGPGMTDHPLHFRNYDAASLAAAAKPFNVVKTLHRGGALYKLAGRAAVEANSSGDADRKSSRFRNVARPVFNAALRALAPIDDWLATSDERPEELWVLARRDT
jgi:2-polyprenyl-3-methyl-5-hydroxy-6-metoxy-1,4-benzoquinol methylase